jgi:hypothetical protein
VLVNGILAVDHGRYIGEMAGEVLLHKASMFTNEPANGPTSGERAVP